jgi:hypothetical protein
MGTTLTGTTPQDTYDSLIKVTDNGPLSGTLKALSDGLGNDSTLSLSTTAASIAGTLAVTGNATFDTNTLFVDAAANEVGIGTTSPSGKLHISATSGVASLGSTALAIRDSVAPDYGFDFTLEGVSSGDMSLVRTELDVQSQVMTFKRSNGNVGIGTSSPIARLDVVAPSSAISLSLRSRSANDFSIVEFRDNTGAEVLGEFYSQRTGAGSGQLIFTTYSSAVGSEMMRLTPDKYLRLASGTGGIQFNGDTAAANALDDYEEGTWTMGVSFGGASVGVTYANNTGTYTKVGRKVTAIGLMELSNKGSSTGSAFITGLPFAVASGVGFFSAPSLGNIRNITFLNVMNAYTNQGDTTITLGETTNLGAFSALTDVDFANNSEVAISLTYFV